MSKVKSIIDYSSNRYSDSELKVKADTISIGLTNNPVFSVMAEKAVAIKTQNDIFAGWLSKMPDGNKQVTLEKKEARSLLEDILSATSIQVQEISGGDEKLILSAGIDVKRKSAPVGLLERPADVVANPGPTRGSLEISWYVVPNAYMYEVKYTEAPSTPESKWLHTSNSKHKIVLENLIRGKAYAIQVAAAGSDPGRVWSDEIISYVM